MGSDDIFREVFNRGFIDMPERRLKKLDSLFEAFSVAAEGTYVYVCDMRYDVSRWSQSAVVKFGLPSQYMKAAGDIWEKRIHPEDKEVYHKGIEEIFTGVQYGHDMQYRALRTDGEYDVCTCRGTVLKDDNGNPNYFVGVIRNHGIQGHIDTVTGLRNQYGLLEDIQYNIENQFEMDFLMVGIVKFSEFNEVYGYNFGNKILQKFGRYLHDLVGNRGNVYRLDGTKFAIISRSFRRVDIPKLYEEVRRHLRTNFVVDDKPLVLDVCAGYLHVNYFDVDHETVYSCVNFAYGESKVRRQGNLVEFYNNLNNENKQRLEKLHSIRNSIVNDYEGFFLVYQPIVDSISERVIGGEALIRWKDEKYGIVPPDLFIPILERDPLFPRLGEWILRKSIESAQEMIKDNPDFVINVNLSYTQLEEPGFIDMVLGVLKDTEFPPKNLCLEITERCRLLDIQLLKNIMVNLRGHGIKIALDDFGTGFSSMSIVKLLNFDIIKIDRSFVTMIEEDEKERALIENFVDIASTFGAEVCVEGIETLGMKDILNEYAVKSFQGYYYAKPLVLDDFMEFIKAHSNK
ncbi:MAG: EAL domain-containing protein [Eubacterium sp.]|nr:EAL domain-containing protein [Eubacterium sp.]